MAEVEYAKYCIQGIVDKAFAMLHDPRNAKNKKIGKEIGLYYAIQGNQLLLAKMLLKAGARVDLVYEQGTMGDNLLECAVRVKDIRMVKLLKRHGYNIKKADKDILFCAMNETTVDIAIELVDGGIDVSKNTRLGIIPLIEAITLGSYTLAKGIIERGTDINAENRYQKTPLIVAVEKNRADIVQLLLKHGAKPDAGKDYKPLLTACASGFADIVKILIDGGADINITVSKLTAINLAIVNDHFNVVKVLVEHGALEVFNEDSGINITERKKEEEKRKTFMNASVPLAESFIRKMNNLDGAYDFSQEEMENICKGVEEMMGKKFSTEQLKSALKDMQPEMKQKMDRLRPLLPPQTEESMRKRKTEIDDMIENAPFKKWSISSLGGLHPMHHAAKQGNLEIMSYLLEHDVDADITDADRGEETPLYHACLEGQEDAVEFLLKQNANPNGVNAERNPFSACLKNADMVGYQMFLPLIKLLLHYGLEIRRTSDPILTAPQKLQVPFSMQKHTEKTTLLLTAGALREKMLLTWDLPWMTSLIQDCATRENADHARIIHLFGFRFRADAIMKGINQECAVKVRNRASALLNDLKLRQQCTLSLRRITANVIREKLHPNAFVGVKSLEIPNSLKEGLIDPRFD